MKSLTQLKQDYLYILEPILRMDDTHEAEKKLTTLQHRIENTILEKQTKLKLIKDLKHNLRK